MKCKDGVKVIFLCSLLVITYKASMPCDYKILAGQDVIIVLPEPYGSTTQYDIRWIIDTDSIKAVIKKSKKTAQAEMMDNGSLSMKNTEETDSGKYTFQVYDKIKGEIQITETKQLCVFERTSKPVLNFTCLNKKIKLSCVHNNKNTNTILQKDGKNVPYDGGLTVEENGRFQCIVSNPVHNSTSDAITTSCPTDEDSTLFGFKLWIMVVILAVGGGLVLLLMVVLIICACKSCKRREKHERDKDEYLLNYLNAPPPCEQRSKQTARGQPAPPVPLVEANDSTNDAAVIPPQSQPKTKGQGRGRPPPPPLDEDEDPPPLPQPRKKAPRPKKSEATMYMQP